MKRIIEIEEREFDLIEETTFVEDTDVMFRQTADDREKTLMMFRIIDAIKQSKPYDDSGDLISREALKNNEPHYDEEGYRVFYESEIDNAQAVDINGNEYFPFRTAYFYGVEAGRATAVSQGEWVKFKDVQSVIKPILKRFYGASDSDIEYIIQEIEQKAYLKGSEEE